MKAINKKFKLDCPKCGNKDKVVTKCFECFHSCCSSCSVKMICIDCYIKLRVDEELRMYQHDKIKFIGEV